MKFALVVYRYEVSTPSKPIPRDYEGWYLFGLIPLYIREMP